MLHDGNEVILIPSAGISTHKISLAEHINEEHFASGSGYALFDAAGVFLSSLFDVEIPFCLFIAGECFDDLQEMLETSYLLRAARVWGVGDIPFLNPALLLSWEIVL